MNAKRKIHSVLLLPLLAALLATLTVLPVLAAAVPVTAPGGAGEISEAGDAEDPLAGIPTVALPEPDGQEESEAAVNYSPLGSGVACLAEASPMIKSGRAGLPLSFTPADFRRALGLATLGSITVTRLPKREEGTLRLSGECVTEGDVIAESALSALTFTAATPYVSEASFSFRAEEGSGNDLTCRIYLTEGVNASPSVAGLPDGRLSVTVTAGTSCTGNLLCRDPDGDDVTYFLVTPPEHGSLILSGDGNGSYRYTPKVGYVGSDSFRYAAVDGFGNYSGIATVSVTVNKRPCDVVFDDMAGSPAEGAVLALCGAGIVQGRIFGDRYLFDPTGTVSRAEFTVMLLKAAGIEPDRGVSETVFDDDAAIPEDLRGYIATAQKRGIVNGIFDGKKLCFRPDSPIRRIDAMCAVWAILGRGQTGVTPVGSSLPGVPAYAEAMAAGLDDLGVLSRLPGGEIPDTSALSRIDAAILLAEVLK